MGTLYDESTVVQRNVKSALFLAAADCQASHGSGAAQDEHNQHDQREGIGVWGMGAAGTAVALGA